MIYKNIKKFVDAINEGLIRTHDINTSISILNKWYISMTNYFNIEILSNDTFEITIKGKISTSLFSSLIKDINNLGYFPSLVYLENENNIINQFKYDFDKINNILMSKNIIKLIIICEKKFDDEIFVSSVIYHVCKEQNIQKIIKNGLCPRAKNRIGTHPERIYFCLNIESCEDLIDKFKINDNIKKSPEQKYHILKIDIPELIIDFEKQNKKIIFRKDPNMDKNGIYTYDNIPGKYIKL
jgi:hypothetical protein